MAVDGQLSPGSGGPLVDPARHRVVGSAAGMDLCWVLLDQRSELWKRIRNQKGERLLYLEQSCP